ncbi:MAG: hypothetical protein ABUR63_04640 [Verrucomicrobiota bacterium]
MTEMNERRGRDQRRGERLCRAAAAAGVFLAAWVAAPPAASAFDPATTHAGLTQQAVIASTLHQVLARRLARPLGLFDPIALHPEVIDTDQRRALLAGLAALDPAGGYRPGDDGVAPGLSFVMAGSVLAKTPPERIQHLFLDPSTGQGLRDDAAVDGFLHAVRVLADSGLSFRGTATGTAFALEGQPSLQWLEAPDNDLGLPVFHQQMERAIADPDPAQRSSALARALLALGGVLTVLEDAGNPAQVRNDFRAAYLGGHTGGPFDRASPFERTVVDLYGLGGIPAAREVVRRKSLREFFTAADGQGLADRTQRRFFSEGTIPEDGVVDPETTTADIVRDARKSLTYALPTVPRLELRQMGKRQYLLAAEGGRAPARRLLGYERVPGRVRFFLDRAVHIDSARALLPEIAGYAAGLIDHLFRAEVTLARDGDRVRATLVAPTGRIYGGDLRLFAEDAAGRRRVIGTFPAAGGAPDGVSVSVPPEARRIAAVLRGQDEAGPVVAFGELPLPPPRP